jgi:hypothetical protein
LLELQRRCMSWAFANVVLQRVKFGTVSKSRFSKIGKNALDDEQPSTPDHPACFLLALFPRGAAFAAAFLRVMCDFSAAPMRD